MLCLFLHIHRRERLAAAEGGAPPFTTVAVGVPRCGTDVMALHLNRNLQLQSYTTDVAVANSAHLTRVLLEHNYKV